MITGGDDGGGGRTLRLVACMGAHVAGDHVTTAGSIRTLRTLVRLFAGMRALMCR